jgi:hypothetical protein
LSLFNSDIRRENAPRREQDSGAVQATQPRSPAGAAPVRRDDLAELHIRRGDQA